MWGEFIIISECSRTHAKLRKVNESGLVSGFSVHFAIYPLALQKCNIIIIMHILVVVMCIGVVRVLFVVVHSGGR